MSMENNDQPTYSFKIDMPEEQAKILSAPFNTHKPKLEDLFPVDNMSDQQTLEALKGLQAAVDAGLKPIKATVTKGGVTIPVQVWEIDDKGNVWGTK